jgi:hypothetical protein
LADQDWPIRIGRSGLADQEPADVEGDGEADALGEAGVSDGIGGSVICVGVGTGGFVSNGGWEVAAADVVVGCTVVATVTVMVTVPATGTVPTTGLVGAGCEAAGVDVARGGRPV